MKLQVKFLFVEKEAHNYAGNEPVLGFEARSSKFQLVEKKQLSCKVGKKCCEW